MSYLSSRSFTYTLRTLSKTAHNSLTLTRRKSSMLTAEPDTNSVLVSEGAARDFVLRCMTKVGTDVTHAEKLAEVLVDGDRRGHFRMNTNSHGINRTGMYMSDVESTMTKARGEPTIVRQTVSTALVNGNDLLGPVVGQFCMQLAIDKAKETGIGFVTVRGTTHFGIAGHYSLQAMHQGMMGVSMTNGAPILVPTRAKKPFVATNPISFAVAGNETGADNPSAFVLDMATSAVAVGKVEIAHRQGVDIPVGWGVDGEGQSTTDPSKVHPGGGVCPLGGGEETSGYKGSGLAAMVEILTAILSGGTFGTHVRPWMTNERPADIGHAFFAIDPACFDPSFRPRLAQFLDEYRNLETMDGAPGPVLVAGDPERKRLAEVEKRGGILYHANIIEAMDKLADKYGVDKIKRKN